MEKKRLANSTKVTTLGGENVYNEKQRQLDQARKA